MPGVDALRVSACCPACDMTDRLLRCDAIGEMGTGGARADGWRADRRRALDALLRPVMTRCLWRRADMVCV